MVAPTLRLLPQLIIVEYELGPEEIGDTLNVSNFSKIESYEVNNITGESSSGSARKIDNWIEDDFSTFIIPTNSGSPSPNHGIRGIFPTYPWIRPRVNGGTGGTYLYRFYCYF